MRATQRGRRALLYFALAFGVLAHPAFALEQAKPPIKLNAGKAELTGVEYGLEHLACDGVTDDRAALAALLVAGGPAAGKRLDMTGCLAKISNAGGDGSVAIDNVDSFSVIQCDGSLNSGFVLDAKVCVGGDSPGAGCSTSADCAGTATCSGSQFAPTSGSVYRVFGAAAGTKGQKLLNCSLQSNQAPRFGTCVTTNAGQACRSLCSAGAPLTNFTCDADADCIGGGTCVNQTSNCATTCTGAGIWPAGTGSIVWADWDQAVGVEISGNRVMDLGKSASVFYVADGLVANNEFATSAQTPKPITGWALGNNWPAATTYAVATSVSGGNTARVIGNRGVTGTGTAITTGTGSLVERNAVTDATASAVGISAGSGSQVNDNVVTNAGASATGISVTSSNVKGNVVTTNGATAVGILTAGSGSQVVANSATANGLDGIPIKVTGTQTSVTGNFAYAFGGGTDIGAGISLQSSAAQVAANYVQYAGGAAGIDIGSGSIGSASIVGNSISGVASFTWGPGVRIGSQQNIITGNTQFNNGFCVRSSEKAGGSLSINYQYVTNRCFAPYVACAALVTGTHFSNNYCAWVGDSGVAVFLGDSGRHANELCTGSGTSQGGTWSCCNTTDKGNCDGSSEGATPGSGNALAGYGAGAGHGNIVGNLLHVSGANRSVVKFAGPGKRCGSNPANGNDCTAAAGTSGRGNLCPCTGTSDCAGSSPSCTAQGHGLTTISGNLIWGAGTNSAAIDMLLIDDSFGVSTTEDLTTDTTTTISNINVSGNVIAGVRAFNITSNGTAQANIVDFAALANVFSVTTKFTNWLWTMGVKDDNPVAILLGSTAGPLPASNVTQYVPLVGPDLQTTEANIDMTLPAGVAFRGRCRLGAALASGDTRVVTLRKNAAATAMTCTISGAGADVCTFPTTEVSFAELDRAVWEFTGAGTPTSQEAYCTLLYEITQPELGWGF